MRVTSDSLRVNLLTCSLMEKGTAVVSTPSFRRIFTKTPILGMTTSRQKDPRRVHVRPLNRKTSLACAACFWRPATMQEVKGLFCP